MDPERWRRIETLCHEAAAREGDERAAFLAEACGDDAALRHEVASLLVEQAGAEAFLASAAWRTPALEPGTRLGPHEILGLVGSGGMGEVYKARDTRLDRTVALKILPPEVSSDPERRARFAREAKTISQLSHPNICTLFDIGEAELPSAQRPAPSAQYLVMEFLEGETLAARLARGGRARATGGAKAPPLHLEEALQIGAEIADALAAAHKHGIVHRDLKPGNVMLTSTGVKLLDFGLAKLRAHGERPVVEGATAAPTESEPLTGRGVIVGTLPYMAPEQLEGKPADARTDLWALGTILYEMLAGKRAFDGDSSASLIGAILEREPEPIAERQPLTPPALDRLVRKCLAKAPDNRWDTAHDVADELRWIAQSGATDEQALSRAERGPRRLAFGVLALVMVAVASVMLTWLAVVDSPPPAPPVTRSEVTTAPADGLLGGYTGGLSSEAMANRPRATAIALTPDGRRLVFAGREGDVDRLYVLDFGFGEAEARPIPGTEGADGPFVSPDGQWAGFSSPVRILKRVRVDGSSLPVEIASGPPARPNWGASWGDDGTIVFSGASGGLWRQSANGGPPEQITWPAGGEIHRLPHILPGSRAVLFTVASPAGPSVAVHRLGSKGWQRLVPNASDARYVRTGHLVYFHAGTLNAVPFDLAALEVSGPEVRLFGDVMQTVDQSGFGHDAQVAIASESGTLAYVAGGVSPEPRHQLVWVDRHGGVEPLSVEPGDFSFPRLDPDGARLAVLRGRQPRMGVWVHHLNRPGSLSRASDPGIVPDSFLWTRDGRQIVFRGWKDGAWALFSTVADGSRPAEILGTPEGDGPAEFRRPASWTSDGRLLTVAGSGWSPGVFDILLRSWNGDTWADSPLIATQAAEFDAQVSPNGRLLAYFQSPHVFVIRFPGLTDRQQLTTDVGGRSPRWSRDGRELFYIRARRAWAFQEDEELVVHAVGPDDTIDPVGRPLFRLKPLRLSSVMMVPPYDVSLDGQRFLFVQLDGTPAPPLPNRIHIIQNWFEELKAKVGG